jgi:hypothetical protein
MISSISIAIIGIIATFAYLLLTSGSRDARFPTGINIP